MSKKFLALAGVTAAMFAVNVTSAHADTTTVVVTDHTVDTSAGENGSEGWWFNRDASTSSPYEFTDAEASIGDGSLHVEPIGSDPADKFIAENFVWQSLDEFESISYDFLIAGNGDAGDANEFYLNLYVNLPGSEADNYYDCRFDFVPTTGSTTDWTTATFDATSDPVNVNGAAECPDTVGELPEGSTLRMYSLSVGDTSDNDTGLAGYLDNVQFTAAGDTTVYDFEVGTTPDSKNDCKKGGWESFNSPSFRNQGDCVSYVATGGK